MLKDLTIYFLTWNVAGQQPTEDLQEALGLGLDDGKHEFADNSEIRNLHDIYVVGLQEVSVKPHNFIYDLIFDDPWIESIKSVLAKLNYVRLRQLRLQGIVLLIFCKRDLLTNIRGVQTTYTRTGLGGAWGNKGGASLHMSLNGCSICITSVHMAAHDKELEQRVLEYNTILDKQKFIDPETQTILAHDYVFWFGDLNFRIDNLTAEEIVGHIKHNQLSALFDHDQLKKVMCSGEAFSEFVETEPTFPPTYRYIFHSNEYDAPIRKPAWTDRILYRLTPNAYENRNITLQLKQLHYSDHKQYTLSDHKPVSSLFSIKVFSNPDLVKVDFQTPQTWKVNSDGEAWYRFTLTHKPHPWDWVGLFRAGFIGIEEHLHYVWANTLPCETVPDSQEQEDIDLLTAQGATSAQEWGSWYKVLFADQALLVPGSYRLLYIRGRFNDVLGMSRPLQIS